MFFRLAATILYFVGMLLIWVFIGYSILSYDVPLLAMVLWVFSGLLSTYLFAWFIYDEFVIKQDRKERV